MVRSRRGRAGRDLEAAPHGGRAVAHPGALDGGAVPEQPPRDRQGRSTLRPNQPVEPRSRPRRCPPSTPLSQPYWLREEGTAGPVPTSTIPSLIGRPENPPAFPLEYVFEVGGQTLVIAGRAGAGRGSGQARDAPAGWRSSRRSRCGSRRASGSSRPAPRVRWTVELTAARAPAPPARCSSTRRRAGRSTPASQPFRLAAAGDARALHVHRDRAGAARDRAAPARAWRSTARRFNQQRVVIRYDHIPLQLLQPPARA